MLDPTSAQVSAIARKLQNAIEAGDFVAAQPLVLEYGRLVRDQLRSTTNARERQAVFDDALETLHANLCLARLVRSHICAHLQAVTGQMQYHALQNNLHTWNLQG
jgi:hypothetical protein